MQLACVATMLPLDDGALLIFSTADVERSATKERKEITNPPPFVPVLRWRKGITSPTTDVDEERTPEERERLFSSGVQALTTRRTSYRGFLGAVCVR